MRSDSRNLLSFSVRGLLCGLLLLVCLSCKAQRAPEEPTLARIASGVRLILKSEPASDLLAITLFVRMEADTDPQQRAVRNLVAQALFYGSANRSFDSIADSVARVGGSLETLLTESYLAVTCLTVPAGLNEVAYLISEALKNADFNPEALERARKTLREQRLRRRTSPQRTAEDTLLAHLKGFSQEEERLEKRVTSEQALAYFRARYLPERIVIAAVGRFDAKRAQALFENNLFDFARLQTVLPHFQREASPPPKQGLTIEIPGKAAFALIATEAPDVSSPDYPAFLVLNALLGRGHASRLFRSLRDNLGIGYEVGSLYQPDTNVALLVQAQWDPGRQTEVASTSAPSLDANAILKRLYAQVESILQSPPDAMELTRARKFAIGREALAHERTRERAFHLGWYETMGLGFAFDAELPKRLATVTQEDIVRVAKTYLNSRSHLLALPRPTR